MPRCFGVMMFVIIINCRVMGVIHGVSVIWVNLSRLLQVGSVGNFGFLQSDLCPFPILDTVHLPPNKVGYASSQSAGFHNFFLFFFGFIHGQHLCERAFLPFDCIRIRIRIRSKTNAIKRDSHVRHFRRLILFLFSLILIFINCHGALYYFLS